MPLFGRGRPTESDLLLSTGFPALDAAVGGGLRPGAVGLVRPGGSATIADFRAVQLLLVLGALAAGRGSLVVAAPNEDPAALWSRWHAGRRGLDLDGRVRIADYALDRMPLGPWHVPLHPQLSARIAVPRMAHAEEAVRGPEGLPFLEITCLDTLDQVFGPAGAERVVRSGLSRRPPSGNWMVYWGLYVGRALGAVQPHATVELTLARDRAGLSVAGVRPGFAPIFLTP